MAATRQTKQKIIVTLLALVLLGLHTFAPRVLADLPSVGLLALAILPWLSGVIKRAEIPGLGTIELQGMRDATDVLERERLPTAVEPNRPAFATISPADPQLPLVGLRIELERRLSTLAAQHGVAAAPLRRAVESLVEAGVLPKEEGTALQRLIDAGNRAAHGTPVDPELATWAQVEGPKVLLYLKRRERQPDSDVADQLDRAETILEFLSDEHVATSMILLALAKRDGFVKVSDSYDVRAGAKDALVRLGALDASDNEASLRFATHFTLTSFGRALLARLLEHRGPQPDWPLPSETV